MLKPGDVCRTASFQAKFESEDGKHEDTFGFKPPARGDRFNFIYLGLHRKGYPDFDAEGTLRQLGWQPSKETEELTRVVRELLSVLPQPGSEHFDLFHAKSEIKAVHAALGEQPCLTS